MHTRMHTHAHTHTHSLTHTFFGTVVVINTVYAHAFSP